MQAARDEPCTINIAACCNYRPETSVMAHLPDGSGGTSRLTGPLSIAIACSDCHDAIDGRRYVEMGPGDREFYLRRGQNRTINRLIDKGLLKLKGQ